MNTRNETRSESTKRTQAISKKYDDYLLSCIDGEGYDIPSDSLITTEGKLRFLHDTFIKEYWYPQNQQRYSTKENAFREWLMGLPSCFNIEFENYKILELARLMGSLPQDSTESQEDKIINNYFNYTACKVFKLFRKFGIK